MSNSDSTGRTIEGQLHQLRQEIAELTKRLQSQQPAGAGNDSQDNTDRKQAEERNRDRESMLEGVYRATPVGITFNIDRVILSVNESMSAISGYSKSELVGQSARVLYVTQEEFDLVGQEMYPQNPKRWPVTVETRFQRKDGSIIFVILTAAMLRLQDSGTGFVVTVQDITERKRAELEKSKLQEQLQQAMKMEAVGRLAGGIAHDFNNLLTAITGNVELARMDLGVNDPPIPFLDEIEKAARSAASLTRQLLAFSRQQIIEPKIVNLNELVERMHNMLLRLIGEDIELKANFDQNLDSVMVDPGQFEQVLANLVVNARDAMPDGGRLQIETMNIDLEQEYCSQHAQVQPGKYVALIVSDTGQGMTEQVKQQLFEPFFTTKPKGIGTGLGLATAFGTVKQAGGTIDVYSEVGLGTTFKIYLPRAETPALGLGENRSVSKLARGHETILVVEDNESVRGFVQEVLNRLGYTVLCASNGTEALLTSEQSKAAIHLLLTDVIMPGMSGRELAERLLQLRPDIKVLFTSGYTQNVIVHRGVLEEKINFIGKPYSMQTLAAKIRDVLEA